MTITPCARAARYFLLPQWAAVIIAVVGAIIGTILAIGDNIRRHLASASGLLPQCRGTALYRLMMSKPGLLPFSATPHKGSAEFRQAVMTDLRGKGEVRIEESFSVF